MQINATFIVQMANFALCSVVLSKFLFKPFMQAIQEKQAARQTLNTILDNKGRQEQLLIQSKHDRLASFKAHIKDAYQPPIITSIEQPSFAEKPMSEAYVQEMIQKATAVVIEKVFHAK
ncbi:hypothetical protein FJ365_05025 [Candidatus Dependentiae bacterium]|nr:hypothetical protein [Candidatus Dependentiae bacterium]